MHKAVFEINHIGCWGSNIGLKFPNFDFSSIDVRWIKDSVAHILKATGNTKNFDEIIKYLKEHQGVQEVEILSKDNELYLRTLTKDNAHHPSFSNMFFENSCFPVEPTKFENKYEVWTLGSSNRNNLTKVYNKIKEKYSVNIKYIKEESIKAKLTDKQRKVFMYAKYFGYYNWPRKKSATEIANLINVPKTVFLSHLRKAENNILNSYSP